MKKFTITTFALFFLSSLILVGLTGFNNPENKNKKSTSGGEVTFTVRSVTANGTYAPKHVLAIWVEDADGFVKTRKAMGDTRLHYLYTWVGASNYNVVDAITGSTINSHQTHTVSWDCTDINGEIIPDGDYTIWAEFTEKHAQGPLFNLTFTKGPNAQIITPPDETYFKDIELEFTPYVADFIADETDICQWGTVTFTDNSINATEWEWDFGEGAAPATASSQGPHTVYYTTPGSKTVSLTINGSLTETKEDFISVTITPTAGFSFTGNALTVNFTNNSTNATSYLWDFGDGNTSTEENPIHTYATAGSYDVNLTAFNQTCEDNTEQQITVPLVSIDESLFSENFIIYPNPGNGVFNINLAGSEDIKINIYDQTGRVIVTKSISEQTSGILFKIDLSEYEPGIYFAKFSTEDMIMTRKLVVK